MKKEKAASRFSLIILCILSLVFFTSCSSGEPKETMYDAVNTVLENKGESLLFSLGKYVYSDQASFDNQSPTLYITFLELSGDALSYLTYSVRDEIVLVGTSTQEISNEEKVKMEEFENTKTLIRLKKEEDLTKTVIEMVEVNEGRRLDEEIYTSGMQIVGEQRESWFFIHAAMPETVSGLIQAAYNVDTGELMVADQLVSEMTGISTFFLGNRLIVSKDLILSVVYSSNPTTDKWEEIIAIFPEAGLSLESTKEVASEIENGYEAAIFDIAVEPIQTYSKMKEDVENSLYLFEDGSWYFTAIEKKQL